jgi:hypothetical protein
MLLGDDMIKMKRPKRKVIFVKATILASPPSALTNKLA